MDHGGGADAHFEVGADGAADAGGFGDGRRFWRAAVMPPDFRCRGKEIGRAGAGKGDGVLRCIEAFIGDDRGFGALPQMGQGGVVTGAMGCSMKKMSNSRSRSIMSAAI